MNEIKNSENIRRVCESRVLIMSYMRHCLVCYTYTMNEKFISLAKEAGSLSKGLDEIIYSLKK